MNFYNVVAISTIVIVIIIICLLVIFNFILVYNNFSFTE